MNKILLIGNSGFEHNSYDGQTVKVRLYFKKIQDEGFDVTFVDLENFAKRPFSILKAIRKGISSCDRIVLISAKRGCKFLIPYINRHNKKLNKPFILPLIGTSVLHHSIDRLSDEQKNDFLINGNYSLCKSNKKMSKQLSRISAILPETDLLVKVFKEFYNLDNVFQLNNFREEQHFEFNSIDSNELRIIFASRVMKMKGIFDVLSTIDTLNKSGTSISMDIYGKKVLDASQEEMFNNYLKNRSFNYFGQIDNNLVCQTISKYDLFVFPTHFIGEGTPGVIVESLIAGVPILTSNFPQAKYLLKDGNDSVFYKMFDNEDLKQKLLSIAKNKDFLKALKNNAKISGEKYTYKKERKTFLKYVCGMEEL